MAEGPNARGSAPGSPRHVVDRHFRSAASRDGGISTRCSPAISDDRCRSPGTRRAARRQLRTAFRLVIGAGIAVALVVSAGREVFGQVPGVGRDVCDRTYQVSDAIVTASGAATCAHVTLRHVREITSLNLRGQGIARLSAGDFDGLVRLHTLDLSDNVLTALPQGVFDEMLLLRTLHLNGNVLRTLPARLFDRLFMLEELTLHSNPLLVLQVGMFAGSPRFAALEESVDLPPWAVDAGVPGVVSERCTNGRTVRRRAASAIQGALHYGLCVGIAGAGSCIR